MLAAREPGRPPRLFAQPIDGGAQRAVTPEGVSARHVVLSPDGQWVVGYEREGPPALYPLGGGEPRPVSGADKDDLPLQWSADGRATLRVLIHPLVSWLWAGGAVLALGVLWAAWPARRAGLQRARGPAGDRPHRCGNHLRPGAAIRRMKACAPQLGRLDHVGIHIRCLVERDRGIVLEEVHHLGCNLAFVFEMNSFDDGFRRGAMPAACIGEVKDNVWFSSNRRFHLCVP